MREHTHHFRPIYGDTDMMGVVYYGNYLRYFEAGRSELLRAAGFEYSRFEEAGFLLPVAEAHAKYHKPAKYDEELSLTTTVSEVRMGSIRITYRLVRVPDQVLIATGETLHACIDRTGKVVRIPSMLREKLD
jgi:acyl-CoA thioester hydrolase